METTNTDGKKPDTESKVQTHFTNKVINPLLKQGLSEDEIIGNVLEPAFPSKP